MPRRRRLQYAGALYHVINRGNYRLPVFGSPGAARAFETPLSEASERHHWRIHAHVVMRNHFHLALETPWPNLIAGMHWLESTFATRFNRFRSERGHVFQGRYQSLLIEEARHPGTAGSALLLWPAPIGVERDRSQADGHKRLKGHRGADHEPLGVYRRRGHNEGRARTGGIQPMVLGSGSASSLRKRRGLSPRLSSPPRALPRRLWTPRTPGPRPRPLCAFCGPAGSSPSLRRGRTPSGGAQSTAGTAPGAGLTLKFGPRPATSGQTTRSHPPSQTRRAAGSRD